MAKNMYEIFAEVEAAKTKQERIEALQRNDCYALQNVLQLALHPDIKFLIDKAPKYKPDDSPAGLSYSSIHQELGRIYLMLEGHPRIPENLTQQRREQILVQMLEALEAKEAEVFMNMILKKLKVKGLDAKTVREAFPGLIPD